MIQRLALLLVTLSLAGCAKAVRYTDPLGPRYAAAHVPSAVTHPCLRLVSFNVAYGQFPERAVALLRKDTLLRKADVLLLQEVDVPSTRFIADSLGMSYVYYPGSVSPFTARDFGNAILSRWPLEDDAKIVLPHPGRFGGAQRIAVAATVRFGEHPIRVYSVHLSTGATTGRREREEQFAMVVSDAERYENAAVGGDFNSSSLPKLAVGRGFQWVTQDIPATAAFWTVDHFVLRNMRLCREHAVGARNDPFDTSDHLPIWVDLAMDDVEVVGR